MATQDLPFWGRINDSHTHVWLGKRLKNRAGRNQQGETSGEAEALLELMDKHGVQRAAIITPTTLGFDNSVTLDLAKAYKERLVPISRFDPYAEHATSQFSKLLDSGSKGVRLSINTVPDGRPLGDPALKPLIEILNVKQIPLLIHCNFDQLHLVRELAEENPKLPILLDHMARVSAEIDINGSIFHDLERLSTQGNVFIKISSTNYFSSEPTTHSDLVPYIERLLLAFGEKRLLWGSDWPLSESGSRYSDSFEPLLRMRKQLGIETLERIFVENFNLLFQTNKAKK